MVFSKKMGAALNDTPLFGTAFNNWFPIVVLFWCGALFLNVWQIIARFVLPARYRFDDRSSGNEHMERGQVLMRKEEVLLQHLLVLIGIACLGELFHVIKLLAVNSILAALYTLLATSLTCHDNLCQQLCTKESHATPGSACYTCHLTRCLQ